MSMSIPLEASVQVQADLLSRGFYQHLFPTHLELVPQLNEVYELALAYFESQALSQEDLIQRGAYFARVGETLTRHYLMCRGESVRLPKCSSEQLRSFFQTNQFKTGYATHGLFPYRGKFHPQMVKGLLNAMGLRPGEMVLDPMMGSGTVLVEAKLMGLHSLGLDVSPFCQFMSQVKLDALTLPLAPIRAALEDCERVHHWFALQSGRPRGLLDGYDHPKVAQFLLLAYLDSIGYAERSKRLSPLGQFRAVLERYLFVAEKIQSVLAGVENELGEATALVGDARALPLPAASVDGILFSPPYSFAIDYLANDAPHLDWLGVNRASLYERMLGLRGETPAEQYALYCADMDQVLAECSRVLRPGRICTIIVGTNSRQLSKILRVSPDEVHGLDELMVEWARKSGLHLIQKLSRQIIGMANTMRMESILLLKRTP